MPEQTDQGKVEQPVEKGPLPGQSQKLPERGFFEGDNLMKYAEQLESAETSKEKPVEQKPAAKQAKEEPCVGCDDEAKAKAKAKEERTPIRVLKVKGKEIPVYSDDELTDLAQKGAYMTQERQKDAEWERDLETRQKQLDSLAPTLKKIVDFLDSGGRLPGMQPVETKPKEEAQPEEEILDPVAAKKFNQLSQKIDSLEKENKGLRERQQSDLEKRAETELTETFTTVTKEHPFEEVMDPETEGRNISKEIYSGLVSFLANRDYARMKSEPGFKMRQLQEYMTAAARDLSVVEKHLRSGGGQAAMEITPETVKTKYPEVAESLGQEAIETYLKSKKDGSAPVLKSSKTEPLVAPGKKKISGIADAFSQGLADPGVIEGLEEIGRKYKAAGLGG